MIVISQATLLYRLQTLDLATGHLQSRLDEIEKILGANEKVIVAQETLAAAEKALAPWQASSLNLDLEIKGVVQKLQTTEQQLYSGRVSNPKELQEMESEIASLKRRQSQLEDALLEAMVNVENGQSAVATAKQNVEAVQAEWAASQTDLIAEKKRLEADRDKMRKERAEAIVGVEAANLAKYETLRVKKRGQAVALLDGDHCKACGVEQTSMIGQQVRQEGAKLVICGSCGRILATA